MRNRPKRFGLNDYNLGDGGKLLRGSLEKNDGIEVPFGVSAIDPVTGIKNYGWIPSIVTIKIAGRNVRFALEWRFNEPARITLRKQYAGLWYHQHKPKVPFGWIVRRQPARDVYEIAPMWVLLPQLLRELRHRIERAALRAGAAAWRGEQLVWWPAQDWGP